MSASATALGMGTCAYVSSFEQLLFARALAGLGIGGILPTMAAMAAEFSNEKSRNFSVALVQSGWPVGAVLTGLFAATAIEHLGWRGIFAVAALTSAATIPAIFFLMPESLEFLAKRQPRHAKDRINSLLRRMHLQPIALLAARPVGDKDRAFLGALLERDLRTSTLMLWTGVFFGFVTLYTLISWVPSFARTLGMTIEQSIHAGTVLNVGSFFGSALLGWLSQYFGLKRAIATFLLSATVLMIAYAYLRFGLRWCSC